MDIIAIQSLLTTFAKERDWEQFHSPKNLSMALAAEVGELLEVFMWSTEETTQQTSQNPQMQTRVREELADIFIYLLRIADICQIDLETAVKQKIEQNALKYPVHLAKGNSRKYDDL
jgi:NTP pyrophosphatase (non-canonical NTP hydrolase)